MAHTQGRKYSVEAVSEETDIVLTRLNFNSDIINSKN